MEKSTQFHMSHNNISKIVFPESNTISLVENGVFLLEKKNEKEETEMVCSLINGMHRFLRQLQQ